MRAVVVYESMFGSTRAVAEAVGAGLADVGEVVVVPVREAERALAGGCDLLVVGAPTHAHGLPRARTRQSAAEMAARPGSTSLLEPHAAEAGVREWFARIPKATGFGAAFDTRLPFPLAGRAAKRIGRELAQHGWEMAAVPEGFLVNSAGTLQTGEAERASAWGRALAAALGSRRTSAPSQDETHGPHST